MKIVTKKAISIVMIALFIGTIVYPVSGKIENKLSLLKEQGNAANDLDFDQNITMLMKQGNISSLSACIIKNNEVVWYGGYGFYNRLLRKKPDINTVYLIGSVTKTVTATAILQLYEKGLFNLSDDVNNYLDFKLRNPNYPDVPITFSMLLSHQSSLSEDAGSKFTALARVLGFPKYAYKNLKELLVPGGHKYNPDVWLNYSPGEEFNYSNVGFSVLAYLVERISGQSFGTYCKEHIFKPLDMNDTGFYRSEFKRRNLAIPYRHFGEFYIRMPNIDHPMPGSTGIRTSISDLSHFLIAHMNNGTYNGKRILKNETIELMHTIQNPKNGYNFYLWNYSFAGLWKYGLGWEFYNESGIIYQGHSGGDLGFNTFMGFRVSDNVGVILFFTPETPINTSRFLDADRKIVNDLFLKADEFQ